LGQLTKVSFKFPVQFFPSLIILKFLSQEGKERHFKLGQLNRERYGNFLSETYNPDEIYVRSTDVDRTLMSAECHLAGLFQPSDNQTWHPDLAWQPIPVHTIAKEQGKFEFKSRVIENILSICLSFDLKDLLLVLESECPRYDELLAQLNSSPDVRKPMDSNKEMLDYLAVKSGLNMTEIDDIEYLYDTLLIEVYFISKLNH
jgi:lysosomal acid phosphatase